MVTSGAGTIIPRNEIKVTMETIFDINSIRPTNSPNFALEAELPPDPKFNGKNIIFDLEMKFARWFSLTFLNEILKLLDQEHDSGHVPNDFQKNTAEIPNS